MELWSAYFLVKLFLYAHGDMDFHVWSNLAFAAFTALSPSNNRQRFAKKLIAVPVGAALLYYDSRLPPLTRVLQIQKLHSLEPMYLWASAYRSISWTPVLELLVLLCAYVLLHRKLRMSTFAFIGMMLILVAPAARFMPVSNANFIATPATPDTRSPQPTDSQPADPRPADIDARNLTANALDARLARFYADERLRQVRFAAPAPDGTPYDILILHVSSLSWDDLQAVDPADDSLFSRFDIVFSRFNSAASYSDPAALRLLRGACGQTTEKGLADLMHRECSVIDGLKDAGFEFEWLMNHDDRSGELTNIMHHVAAEAPPPLFDKGAKIVQLAADGSAIYGDYSSLSRWLAMRATDPAPRVALYYNSISLRGGNRAIGKARADSTYGDRLSRLMGDINRFLDDLKGSGRHAVVVFIADHGAALRADRQQITGLREIPTAAIVQVPVGVALINVARDSSWSQKRIDSPTSYLAVNELLTRFLAHNPFDKPAFNPAAYVQALPRTDLVAENDGITVMQIGRTAMMRAPDGAWSTLGVVSGP